jgi:hypothetical protein
LNEPQWYLQNPTGSHELLVKLIFASFKLWIASYKLAKASVPLNIWQPGRTVTFQTISPRLSGLVERAELEINAAMMFPKFSGCSIW